MLCNCLYRSTILYIIIAEWLGHCSCEPQVLSSNPAETFVKCYLNKFLKVIFLPKNDFHLLFVHSYLSYVTFFIIKVFCLDLRKFIQVWWATLSINRPCLFPEMYVFTLVRKRGVICAVYFTHTRSLLDI